MISFSVISTTWSRLPWTSNSFTPCYASYFHWSSWFIEADASIVSKRTNYCRASSKTPIVFELNLVPTLVVTMKINNLVYCYDIPQMAYVIFKCSMKLKDCGRIITILKENWYKRISYCLILFFIACNHAAMDELQFFSTSTIESNFEF